MNADITHPDPSTKEKLTQKLEKLRDHIQNHPWGVRPIYEVFRLPQGKTYRYRDHVGYYFDEEYANDEAKFNGCTVAKAWAVRCGTLWFKIASVYPLNISTAVRSGSGKVSAHDPEKDRSIYEKVEPKSRWRPVMDLNTFYIVNAVLTAKYDNNKANRVQVIYYDERYPDTLFCHPMTRWHTSFVEVKKVEQ